MDQSALMAETADRSYNPPAYGLRSDASAGQRTPNRRSILFLIDQLTELGGGERVMFQLARELPAHGFSVSVVTFRSNPNPAAYGFFPGLHVMPLHSVMSLAGLRVAFQLRSLIKREAVTIVQTSFESADLYGSLVARLSGVRRLVSSRRDMGILRSHKHRILYRLLAGNFSKVLAVSHQVRRWHIEADGLHDDRVVTIHNGLSTARFVQSGVAKITKEHLGLPDQRLLTTVANINVWKGVDVFLRVAAQVSAVHPDVVYAIAGEWTDAQLTAELRLLAASLGIADKTYFLGRVEDVSALLAASCVFALLSRSEGFPNVVLEAMAAGAPVVATSVGGTPEAIEDGVTGFLINAEDAASATTHVCRLLSDAPLHQRVSSAARSRVQRDFSLQQMVCKHVEVYDALLQQR